MDVVAATYVERRQMVSAYRINADGKVHAQYTTAKHRTVNGLILKQNPHSTLFLEDGVKDPYWVSTKRVSPE